MAYTYPVKWITSTMRGAPAVSGTAGTFIGALDAFLFTGWGLATALSVTVENGVGTATFAEGTYFDDFAVVAISGVTTPAALNGEARVLSHTNNSITFETDAPNSTATTGSSIAIKYAPVGNWEKKYFGVNLGAYKSTDVMAHGCIFRVDDTGTMTARVVGYESMTDVNTGIGPFPAAAYVAGGGYVYKSGIANATAARYSMAADSRTVLLGMEPGVVSSGAYRAANIRGFGDAIALAPGGDAWASFVSLVGSASTYLSTGSLSSGPVSSVSGFTTMPRAYSAVGGAVICDATPFSGAFGTMSGTDNFMGAAPSAVDGQIKLSKVFLKEQGGLLPPRALVPGVVYVPQSGLHNIVSGGDIVVGAGEWEGRKLLAIFGGSSPSAVSGVAFIDISGPWRGH